MLPRPTTDAFEAQTEWWDSKLTLTSPSPGKGSTQFKTSHVLCSMVPLGDLCPCFDCVHAWSWQHHHRSGFIWGPITHFFNSQAPAVNLLSILSAKLAQLLNHYCFFKTDLLLLMLLIDPWEITTRTSVFWSLERVVLEKQACGFKCSRKLSWIWLNIHCPEIKHKFISFKNFY